VAFNVYKRSVYIYNNNSSNCNLGSTKLEDETNEASLQAYSQL